MNRLLGFPIGVIVDDTPWGALFPFYGEVGIINAKVVSWVTSDETYFNDFGILKEKYNTWVNKF